MEIVHPRLSAAIDDKLFAVSSQKSYKVYLTESRNGSITTEDLKTTRREASKFIAFRAKNLLLSYRSKSALY